MNLAFRLTENILDNKLRIKIILEEGGPLFYAYWVLLQKIGGQKKFPWKDEYLRNPEALMNHL